MQAKLNLLWNLLPLILVVWFVGWVFWRWLKASDEPLALVGRWISSAVVLALVFGFAARAHDEFSKVVAVIVGCVGGLAMTFIWRDRLCEFVADRFTALYTGGKQQVEPTPFYSVAQARRKQGRYDEALAEVRTQLARFPKDFTGAMLLAEIQAEDLNDLPAAQQTIRQAIAQSGRPPKNIAFALNREADWHLKLHQDREGAREALEKIIKLLPETEQAQLAMQRLAHLTPQDMLAEQDQPRRLTVKKGEEYLGLRSEPLRSSQQEEDPATAAANCVAHLEQYPHDYEAREKLALLYARHYQRLDLAADQLEQLISSPNQPAKQLAHWLNLLADLQIELGADASAAKQTLERIVALFPGTSAAENARSRLSYLRLELRPKQASRVVKLGTYEQNLGLKQGRYGETSEDP